MNKKNGGPAFPCYLHPSQDTTGLMSGMTLRDYFAGQALAGLLPAINSATINCDLPPGYKNMTDEELLAEQAYELADAMLKARDRQ